MLYTQNNLTATVINKWVGRRFGDINLQQGLQPFNSLDAAATYTLNRAGLPPAKIKLQVNNIIDSRKSDAISDAGRHSAPGRLVGLVAAAVLAVAALWPRSSANDLVIYSAMGRRGR